MSDITTVGLDLAKNVFFMIELSKSHQVLKRKKLKRAQVLPYFAQHPIGCVAMEACASSHYWAREIQKLGHDVKLLPPQHVKGYLRGQKNDYNDALAIAEACQHGRIRPVTIKTVEQQDDRAFHKLRKGLQKEQTRIINQTRAFLAENGVVIARSKHQFCKALPALLADASNGLSERLRGLLHRQYRRFGEIESELKEYHQALKQQAKINEPQRRLQTVRGYGVVNSAEFCSWLGDGKQFAKGRDASAALGLVPRQHSTGGKNVLLGITKRGDSDVRRQIVHGARAVVSRAKHYNDPLSQWINRLIATQGFNKAVVAYANKMVRIGWVVIAKGEEYCAGKASGGSHTPQAA
jgi:transposase